LGPALWDHIYTSNLLALYREYSAYAEHYQPESKTVANNAGVDVVEIIIAYIYA